VRKPGEIRNSFAGTMPEIRLIVSESNGIQLTEIGAACSENLIVTRILFRVRISLGCSARCPQGVFYEDFMCRPPRIIHAYRLEFTHLRG
jgi:hypothetical protein